MISLSHFQASAALILSVLLSFGHFNAFVVVVAFNHFVRLNSIMFYLFHYFFAL